MTFDLVENAHVINYRCISDNYNSQLGLNS